MLQQLFELGFAQIVDKVTDSLSMMDIQRCRAIACSSMLVGIDRTMLLLHSTVVPSVVHIEGCMQA